MKVTITKSEFTPITLTITLETQDELDRLFAVINHQKIQDIGQLESVWRELKQDVGDGYMKYHNKLNVLMK